MERHQIAKRYIIRNKEYLENTDRVLQFEDNNDKRIAEIWIVYIACIL